MDGAFSFGTPANAQSGLSFATQSTTGLVPSLFNSTPQTCASVTSNIFGPPSTTPLFGTNTTVSTGTTPSTGYFSGLSATPRPLTFATPATNLTGGQTSFPSLTLGNGIGTTSSSLIPAPTITNAAAPVGLGGVDYQCGLLGSGSASGKSDVKTAKEQVLPNEIKETVDALGKFVKEQKNIREEISRVSPKLIYKVQEETNALKQLLCILSSGLQRNALISENLKAASAQDLRHSEIAHRTKDLPPSMQFENTAPSQYFQELVMSFEKQMLSCRQQIEQLEQHFASLSQPTSLSPQELNVIVRRLHETFVALAAQLQTVHDQVRIQKEAFTHYRRSVIDDSCNLFERKRPSMLNSPSLNPPVTLGPTPFSKDPSTMALTYGLQRNQLAGSFNPALGGASSALKALGGFGSPSFSSPTVENKNSFQLQKPPSGSKRGKRWTTN